jgi:hypothetical protein
MNETNPIISGCSAWYEQTLGDCAKKESCLRHQIYLEGKKSALPDRFSAHRMCRSRALVFYLEVNNT